MARQGKIARLPHKLRSEVNTRLLNGETGREILNWLNAQPAAQKVWHDRFKGNPASPQNLSEWRDGGYLEWLRGKEKVENLKTLSAFAKDAATVGDITEGAASIAGGELLEQLLTIASDEDADLSELTLAISRLRKGNVARDKLKLDRRKERNREKQFKLDQEKFETLAVEKFIQWARTDEAQEILSSGKPKNIQIGLLREMIWGNDEGDNS